MERFKVAALSDSRFEHHGEMMRGAAANIGATTALELLHEHAEISIVVTSAGIQSLNQVLFSHIGIEPSQKAILAIKSVVHFRAKLEPIVEKFILIENAGFNSCRLTSELFTRLRSGVRLLWQLSNSLDADNQNNEIIGLTSIIITSERMSAKAQIPHPLHQALLIRFLYRMRSPESFEIF